MSKAYTTESLRGKLVSLLDGLEDGSVQPSVAREMVKVSHAILETAKVEIEFAKTQAVMSRDGLGKAEPLRLVGSSDCGANEKLVRGLDSLTPDQRKEFVSHVSRLRDSGMSPGRISTHLECDLGLVTEAMKVSRRSFED